MDWRIEDLYIGRNSRVIQNQSNRFPRFEGAPSTDLLITIPLC